jgi:flagellin-like protein
LLPERVVPFLSRSDSGVLAAKERIADARRQLMKALSGIFGLLLLVLGIVALIVPSITFFTTERVADVGFFAIDMAKPHTIVFNPIVGGAALIAGIVLMISSTRARTV